MVPTASAASAMSAASAASAAEAKAKSSDVDVEKKVRGFQHIIQELSSENAQLKEHRDSLQEETALLKEVRTYFTSTQAEGCADVPQEVKLLEEAGEGGAADVKELREARSTIEVNEQTIKEVRPTGPALSHTIEPSLRSPSSIGKSRSSRASSSPRYTAKTSWKPARPISSASLIVYAMPLGTHKVIAVTPRSQRQGLPTAMIARTGAITGASYVKAHTTSMPVRSSPATLSAAKTRKPEAARAVSGVPIAR